MPAVGQKQGEGYVDSWKMEPLSMAVLAGLTPDDIEVNFYDDRLEVIPYNEKTDLVAINVETYTARRSYQIAANFRQRGVPVILGGYHPTLMPEEAAQFADSVLIGEAEDVWREAINDTKSKSVKKFYRSVQRPILNGTKPRRNIFAGKRYIPITLIESGRGCGFSCAFCSVTSFYKHSYNSRPIEEIVKEIELTRKKDIFFVDDNITADFVHAKKLFRALIPLKINWISQGSINMATDEELLALMKKSGCLGLLIGFESLNEENLAQMGKSWNIRSGEYEIALRKFREIGIVIYGTFIFGYDGDTNDSIRKTLDFALNQKLFLAAFNHLVPFPGTPLYGQLESQKRLLTEKWWLDANYKFGDVAFRPKNFTPQGLSDACMKAREDFYKLSSVLRRATDFQNNCRNLSMAVKYFVYNLFSQREIRNRQGLPLAEGLDSGNVK
jgi:radical SAM superfamily enzyme YgiQ (UPF0313 family)